MRIRAIIIIALWLHIFCAVPTRAAAPLELTLEEAVALALRDNRELKALRLQRALDRFDLFLVQRSYLPQGGISLQGIRRRDANGLTTTEWSARPYLDWTSPIGTETRLDWQEDRDDFGGRGRIAASVRQPLLRGGGLDANLAPLRQAGLDEQQRRIAQEEQVANIVTLVASAYRGLRQAQEALELAELSRQRTGLLLETNRQLVAAGRMAEADIVQAEASMAQQDVAVLEAHRQLTRSRSRLLHLLALESRTEIVASDELNISAVPLDAGRAVEQALSARPDIRRLRLELQRIEIDRQVARNNRLWDVSVVAGYSRWQDGTRTREYEDSSVGLQINVPLADFSGRRQVRGTDTASHIARLRYDESVERVESEVRDAVTNLDSLWRQVETARKARDLARRAVDIQNERLRAGRASNFEVLSMEADLRQADASELSARIAYLEAVTQLDHLTGRTLEAWRISVED